jgi:hypothetical protein
MHRPTVAGYFYLPPIPVFDSSTRGRGAAATTYLQHASPEKLSSFWRPAICVSVGLDPKFA